VLRRIKIIVIKIMDQIRMKAKIMIAMDHYFQEKIVFQSMMKKKKKL
jgi:hypothetical protein